MNENKLPEIKISRIDVNSCKVDLVIENDDIKIKSDGRIMGTKVIVDGKELDCVRRMVIDIDARKVMADVYFEAFVGLKRSEEKDGS